MRVLSYEDLQVKGIRYSRPHIAKLVKARKFPAPFKMNGGEYGPNYWIEDEIDAHIEICAAHAKRDAA
jgi:predicted DNA-binding transcriptional regulator AlpA